MTDLQPPRGAELAGFIAAPPARPRKAALPPVDAGAGSPPAPAVPHRPAPMPRQVRSARVTDLVDAVSGPRTKGRPQPEYPREGYGAYRLWGAIPATAGRLHLWTNWLLGHPDELLYIGITCRAGFVRWVEHSDTKPWARDVTTAEIIRGEHWLTLHDTVIDDRTGLPWLVFDDTATADQGIRPIRPGERVHTEPSPATKHGQTVDVFHLDPAAGVELPGLITEGARSGERRIIQRERPRHNVEHNEGDHAVNRARRRVPRLIGLARRRALATAAAWSAAAILLGWAAASVGMAAGIAALAGIVLAAVVLQAAQLVRLAMSGAPLKPGRRRPRRPAGSSRRQGRRWGRPRRR